MNKKKLEELVKSHQYWLNKGNNNGRRLELSGENLSNTIFYSKNLSLASFRCATLSNIDFSYADLSLVDFSYAVLENVNFKGANLRGADFTRAIIRNTNFDNAGVYEAKFLNTEFYNSKIIYPLTCPSDGAFVGWKKVKNKLIKLQIPEDAKRSSATTEKCRCDKALVLGIYNLDETFSSCKEIVNDNYTSTTLYEVGKMVYPDQFDENRWNECSHGIHFFIDKESAIKY